MRAESQQSGDQHRNWGVGVQTPCPFIPEVFTVSHACEMQSTLASHREISEYFKSHTIE